MPDSFLDTGMLSFRVTQNLIRRCLCDQSQRLTKNLDFEDLSDLPDMEGGSNNLPDSCKTLEKASKTKRMISKPFNLLATN